MSSLLRLRSSLSHSIVRRSFRTGTQVEANGQVCRPTLRYTAADQPALGLPLVTSCQLPLRMLYSTSTVVRKDSLSVQIEEEGQELKLKDNHNNVSLYAVWLRHNCRCPECLTDNGQCTVASEYLDPSVTLHSADISGTAIMIIILHSSKNTERITHKV